ALESGKDFTDAAHAAKPTALLPDEDADIGIAGDPVEDRSVVIHRRKAELRRVLDTLGEDPLGRDLDRGVVLALNPVLGDAQHVAHVLELLLADAVLSGELRGDRPRDELAHRVLEVRLAVIGLARLFVVVANASGREEVRLIIFERPLDAAQAVVDIAAELFG